MKLIDIVEELVSEGHKITYHHRTDGGLIITSIDGKKFGSLTEGNRTARRMVVGGELSEARMTQVKFNVKKYIKLKEGEHKAKGNIDEVLNRKLKQVQRKWREKGVVGQGRISKKKLRYYIKTEGKQKALEYLEGRERYAEGYANIPNVEFLIMRLQRLGIRKSLKQQHMIEVLCDDIRSIIDKFREEWIEPCNKIAYDNSLSIEEKVAKIREIIGIAE